MGSELRYNENEFNNIMGNTSYYKTVQNHVSEIIKQINPAYVLEFGSGIGASLSRFAKENSHASFVGVEFDSQLIEYCKNSKELAKIFNLTFINGDFSNLKTLNLINADMILLMYSYNYIPDPLDNKKEFLTNLYKNINKGTRVVIADWFLTDTKTHNEDTIKEIYKLRIDEGIKSVLWSSLQEKGEDGLDLSKENADVYKKYHQKLLKRIISRENYCATSKKWLIETAKEIGFELELENFVNNTNDAVVVLKK